MSKYIDADLLRRKIAEQMESLPREVGRGAGTITSKGYGMMEAFQIVRSIIDSLQQEQPDEQPEYGPYARQYPKSKVSQEQPEVDLKKEIDRELDTRWKGEYLSTSKFRESARHFYELGRLSNK